MEQWNGHWLMADTLLYFKRDIDGALVEAKAAKAAAPYDANTLSDLAKSSYSPEKPTRRSLG